MADFEVAPDSTTMTQEQRDALEQSAFIQPGSILDNLNQSPPPNPEAPTPEAPLYDLSIGGQVFKVPKEQYDAYLVEKSQQEAQSVAAQQYATQEPQAAPEEQDPNWKDTFYADPDAAMEKFKEDVVDHVQKAVREEYTKQGSKDQFWNDFYSEHKELEAEKDMVVSVLQNNPDIGNLPVSQAGTELAKQTKAELLRIAKSYGGTQEQVQDLGLVGAAQEVHREQSQEQSNDVPVSLSSALDERRKARSKSS